MKIFKHRPLVPVTAAFLLSACGSVIVENYPNIPTNYNEGDFTTATTKGAIATIVVGTPFATQSNGFADRVRGLMKNQVGSSRVNFVSQHGPDTTRPYKVVVVFNPRNNVNDKSVCQTENQTPTTVGSEGQMSVLMVFCEGINFKSGTKGRVSGVVDQNDSKFVSLVRQVAIAMVPSDTLLRHLERSND